jgi:MinD-like ATPase involved in chromosome partitioning or flagellar assembly
VAASSPVLVLLGPTSWEGPLVTGLAHPSSRVVIDRRCLDTADLLAAAEAGRGRVALLGADTPRLDGEVVHRLRALGVTVVGLVSEGDDEAVARLRRWNADHVVAVDAHDLGAAVGAIATAVARVGVSDTGAVADDTDPAGGGRLIAVWGPAGAPGRTSIAIALADEAARAGISALLVDADTWAPSVSVLLGVVDDGAGLASACRRARAGSLDVGALALLARQVRPGFLVLPGIPRSGRWNEVRGVAMADVLRVARSLVDLVVVDCGFSLEADEELAFDTDAPRRNGATFAAIENADVCVVVGLADPVGLVRLVSGLAELTDVAPDVERRVLVTRLRESLVGRRGSAAVAEALHVHAGVDAVWCVPDDRAGYDAALRAGRTLAEVSPSSPARSVLRGVTRELVHDLGLQARQPGLAVAGQRGR